MQVTPRTRPRAAHGASQTDAGSGNGPAEAWAEQIATLLESTDPRERQQGLERFSRDLHGNLGPVFTPGEMLEAFRNAVARGRLRNNPEAHLALARADAERGDRRTASTELLAACRLAGRIAGSDRPADRARAETVNRAASELFYRMGDAYQGTARYNVSRFYSVAPPRRHAGDLVPWAPSGPDNAGTKPVMHTPGERITPPASLAVQGREPEPPTPEDMDYEKTPATAPFAALELLNQAALFWGLLRHKEEIGGYLSRCEDAWRSQHFLAAPLRPDAVADLERAVRSHLNDPDPKSREMARAIRDRFDFNLLMECSVAYWGRSR